MGHLKMSESNSPLSSIPKKSHRAARLAARTDGDIRLQKDPEPIRPVLLAFAQDFTFDHSLPDRRSHSIECSSIF
jgi:hypothetical protein